MKITKGGYFSSYSKNYVPVKTVSGCAAVSMKKRMLKDEIFELANTPPERQMFPFDQERADRLQAELLSLYH